MPDSASFTATRRGSLPLQVARAIAQRILTGTYPPGQTIPVESELMEEFGVSRSAVREAIKLLSAKGLLATRPKLGTQIRPEAQWSHLDPDLLTWRAEMGVEEEFARHLAEVRGLFESEAAALAAKRATPEQRRLILEAAAQMRQAATLDQQVAADLAFHRHVLEAAGNPLLLSLGAAVWGALAHSFAAGVRNSDNWKAALQRHHQVAEAIARGDSQAARQTMLEIITRHVDEVGSPTTASREKEER